MSNDRFEKIVVIAKYFIERYPKLSGQSQQEIECHGASPLSLIMDIECVDRIHNLDLDRMLDDLDSWHVAHDVFGIHKYLDRETKQLTDCWTPRFGRPRKDIHSWNVHTVPDSQGSATYYSLKSYRTKDAK